ncbi:glycerophosphodiester phosphodiesterase [Flavobacterium humi]|uniref:Glycerophosphodiester phosphodiesterase n=1 Tax=Flavobacterium humi TaxID=2562683 RepID=A0A4Z0LCG2_9FLAO|nr:glycerophosphodiester phosphodiesterase [Flavobacterium humi]TGD59545.1 glycerophosphodiester phosphodiesterase [Flavobacterium humi]
MEKSLLIAFLLAAFPIFSQEFDIQGHRGCRGLLPENSIEAMKKAVDLGVTTLELDVVVSADNQVLLSHEPFLSHEICLDRNGNEITEANEKNFNLYQMDYATIRQCDCGSKIHPRFIDQEKIRTYKPLLSEVIDSVSNYIRRKYPKKHIYYNIETKSAAEGDDVFHPKPHAFVDLLLKVLREKHITDSVYIQSFDVRTLQYLHKIEPGIKTVLLVENRLSVAQNLTILGFKPTVYSPEFILLNPENVAYLHQKKINVIPWTVNETADMEKIINMGVDGIISDYPNRYFDLIKRK